MRRIRRAAVVLGLGALVGVFAVPAAADANPYWQVPLGVTAGKASCTVNWLREYWDGPVASYKIWVVPQVIKPGTANQKLRTITVAPQNPGVNKSVAIPGLTKGAAYVFWLEAYYPSYFRTGQVNMQVGRSNVCVPT